jgi:dihydroorotate dehydrogenase electron transfer subunit
MARIMPGSPLSLLGPLGNGWPAPRSEHAILLGGGIGVAPLVMAASEYADAGVDVQFLLGAASASDLLALDEIRATGARLAIATDDGTAGHHGFVTSLLPAAMSAAPAGKTVVLACGPGPMLRAVQRACGDAALECFVSLEQRMGCGVGACLGCAVKAQAPGSQYKKVCTDGPVFDARTVVIEDV